MNVEVIAHPNSKNPRIEERAGILHVYIGAPAEAGKANEAVIAALAKRFGAAKSKVRLARGAKSNHKQFKIFDK